MLRAVSGFLDLTDVRFLLTLPGVDRYEIRDYFDRQAWETVSMRSKKPELLDIDQDILTTPEDVRALRENRPQIAEDWLDQLTRLSEQIPNLEEILRRRKTFEGCKPFEL